MACYCALKRRCCVLLNKSLIASSLTASSCSLRSLSHCRVEVLKFVHRSADATGFVFLDFRQKKQNIASFSYRNQVWSCNQVCWKVRDFFGFLRSSSVSSWLIHCSSSVSFFSDSLWLRFGVKKLSNVQTRFRCDMLKTARWVHHTWLLSRASLKCDFRMNFKRAIKYTFHVLC